MTYRAILGLLFSIASLSAQAICLPGDDPNSDGCSVTVPGHGGGGSGYIPIDWSSGGGGGGMNPGGGNNGRTAGTSMSFNRQPACDREAQFIAQQVVYMTAMDGPIGTMLPLTPTDPHFQDPGWTKWETSTMTREWQKSNPIYAREYRIVMHYMYNVTTRQIFQTKLKNSEQYGCEGILKTN